VPIWFALLPGSAGYRFTLPHRGTFLPVTAVGLRLRGLRLPHWLHAHALPVPLHCCTFAYVYPRFVDYLQRVDGYRRLVVLRYGCVRLPVLPVTYHCALPFIFCRCYVHPTFV